jgi:hypothetical protein
VIQKAGCEDYDPSRRLRRWRLPQIVSPNTKQNATKIVLFMSLTTRSAEATPEDSAHERDGSHCLWVQRLDSAKRPQGQPFEVQPFHYPQVRSMGLWQPGAAGTSIGKDRIVFSKVDASGNIWMAEVK